MASIAAGVRVRGEQHPPGAGCRSIADSRNSQAAHARHPVVGEQHRDRRPQPISRKLRAPGPPTRPGGPVGLAVAAPELAGYRTRRTGVVIDGQDLQVPLLFRVQRRSAGRTSVHVARSGESESPRQFQARPRSGAQPGRSRGGLRGQHLRHALQARDHGCAASRRRASTSSTMSSRTGGRAWSTSSIASTRCCSAFHDAGRP